MSRFSILHTLIALTFGSLAAVTSAQAQNSAGAETIIYPATVITMDDRLPTAAAA